MTAKMDSKRFNQFVKDVDEKQAMMEGYGQDSEPEIVELISSRVEADRVNVVKDQHGNEIFDTVMEAEDEEDHLQALTKHARLETELHQADPLKQRIEAAPVQNRIRESTQKLIEQTLKHTPPQLLTSLSDIE